MLKRSLRLVAGPRGQYDLPMQKHRAGMPRLFILLSLALAGLMILQVLLLRYAWDLKEQAFTRGARSALAATVMALESREIEGSAYEYYFSQSDSSHVVVSTGVPVAPAEPQAVAPLTSGSPRYKVAPVGPGNATAWTSFPDRTRFERRRLAATPGGARDSIVVVMTTAPGLHTELHAVGEGRPMALRRVVGEWINRVPAPMDQRLDLDAISEVLVAELGKVGIGTAPRFGVVQSGRSGLLPRTRMPGGSTANTADGDVILATDNITDAELLASPYRQQLFPLDPFGTPYDLVIAFPSSRLYLLRRIGPLWLASALFIGVIIVSFARAWRTNAEQRRFADQLVDFINNMTHEFKTPISTVGLAGEALARLDVRGQPDVVERYVGMIRDENERMHRQVEKILQMARFERGDIELKRELVDLHEVLAAVAEAFALRIDQRGGELVCEPAAPRAVVAGDRVHLAGILSNLVDNAVKYSPEAPRVKVSTAADGDHVLIRVTDQGLGISREDQRRVFEKYYRCPTGNRHDVKGYGLGLSFVQSLVRAHGGHVELHSLPGRGTTVTVSLPLAAGEPEGER